MIWILVYVIGFIATWFFMARIWFDDSGGDVVEVIAGGAMGFFCAIFWPLVAVFFFMGYLAKITVD